MTPDEMKQLVVTQAEILSPRMYEGVSSALADADVRARGFRHTKYPHFRPMAARLAFREYLETEGLPPQWQVDGNPAAMGQLYLSAPELGLKLRFLKERRKTYPSGVPVAGNNRARRDAWTQSAKQGALFTRSDLGSPQKPLSVHELLLLWDYKKKAALDEGFTLRIVRPLAAGVYGNAVPFDLDIALRPGGSIFTTMAFAGDSDDEDFFDTAQIDRAEINE
ncbi:hypothetical protein ACFWAY_24835 [Rhodococcus sp. NPDC059968]|uniref:hypothetical protein n=1 Tax=Rhodococcus sp. NPDC059968 TaxID=3347017 RepID=UPI0036725923